MFDTAELSIQGFGKNWMYVVLEACCTAWGIPLVPGKHLPQVAGTCKLQQLFQPLLIGVANPDPGFGAFLTPASGMGKKSGSGSWMNNPDHISDSLETIFWGLKYLNSLIQIRDPGWKSDPVWKKFVSGINIPDPQDCFLYGKNTNLGN
jgi:hypothetical protein